MQTSVPTPPLCRPWLNYWLLHLQFHSLTDRKVYRGIGKTSHKKKPLNRVFPTGKYGLKNSNKEGDYGCHLISPSMEPLHSFSPVFSMDTPQSPRRQKPVSPMHAPCSYKSWLVIQRIQWVWVMICLLGKENPGLETGALLSLSQGSWECLAFRVHVPELVFLCYNI